ncbi:MAG: diacylglycerol kinase family protein [Chitinophagales bacterium]|nr:diacylglycerol kinase family protein [Chitinophagales bacterium]
MRKFLFNRIQSFKYAFRGLKAACLSETHMRIHLLACLTVIVTGTYFQISPTEWALVVFAMGLVIVSELLNTAIEHLTNLVHPERHPMAGRIKDIAAGAVLVAAITAVVIAALVFGKYLANSFPA